MHGVVRMGLVTKALLVQQALRVWTQVSPTVNFRQIPVATLLLIDVTINIFGDMIAHLRCSMSNISKAAR